MKTVTRGMRTAIGVVFGMTVAFGCDAPADGGNEGPAAEPDLVSRPGKYVGYSSPTYDGYERSSFYVPMRDGTRLAMDLYRPTREGVVASEPLPVVWMHTPYNRRNYGGQPTPETYPGYAARLIPHGYNVAVVDFRGLYGSFGSNGAYNRGEWVDAARMDAYDVTEWLASQDWSNGRIGMWGCSATGGSQMQAATTAPPSLRAIFPMSCEFDVYPFAVSGGVAGPPGGTTREPGGGGAQAARDQRAVAVDGPDGLALLENAIAEHANNMATSGYVPFRDSRSEALDGVQWWFQSSPHSSFDTLRDSEIAIYAAANWDEAGTKSGAAFTFKNLESRAKLIFGPSGHCDWDIVQESTGFDIVVEELRFFDYWLKGIENGVMDEPRVTYFTYNAPDNAPEGSEWRTADSWPLSSQVRTDFFLGEGALTSDPSGGTGATEASIGDAPRISSTGVGFGEGGVAFVTEPLAEAVEVTGHPVVSLRIETVTATDVDAFVILEDVAPDGSVISYQMNGQLRASRRALADAPFDNLGLPWHSHLEADAAPLVPGDPVVLEIAMLPMSYLFLEGHRIQLRVKFSDPAGEPAGAGTVRVLHLDDQPSRLTLPVIPAG